jgi:hypothetical protein
MMTLNDIRRVMYRSMPVGVWIELDRLYSIVEESGELKDDDYEPSAPGNTEPKWYRNVRNVLQRDKEEFLDWNSATHEYRRNLRYYALLVNPRIYEIDQAIQNLTRDLWVVPPRRGEIYSGDRVIICRGMKDGHRGIVAFGEVVGNSRETADIGNVYWNNSSDSEVIRSRVPIEFRLLANGPLWTDQHPMLEDLSVFRSTGGSKFNVTSDQWEQIIEIAGGWPDSSNGSNSIPPISISMEDQDDFDPSNLEDQRARDYRKIVMRVGQPKFRRDLLSAYQNRCAVTGCDVPEALEAAHIYHYQGPETNYVSNGLVLRSDIHALFDKFLLTIDSNTMTVVINQNLEHTSYSNLSGVRITVPMNAQLQPNKSALDIHRAKSGL